MRRSGRKPTRRRQNAWKKSTQPIRDYIWQEVIGRLPDPSIPADPRTRLIFDEPKYRGYEVMLDVWPGVFAYGILLVPKEHRAGESAARWSSASTDWKAAPPMRRIRKSTRTFTTASPFAWPKRAS